MKRILNPTRLAFMLAMSLLSLSCGQKEYLTDYVNPFIGTAQKNDGAVCPFVGEPFAMTKLTPQTRHNAVCITPYIYEDTQLFGFLASHQPLVGCMGDYGYVSLMPQVSETVLTEPHLRALTMDKASEKASPQMYSVNLQSDQGQISVRMSQANAAGIFEFAFPEGVSPRVIVQGTYIDPSMDSFLNNPSQRIAEGRFEGWIHIDPATGEVYGYNPDRQSAFWGPELPNFKGWFCIRFDQPFTVGGCYNGDVAVNDCDEGTGTNMGAWVNFAKGTKQVRAQLGTSFISLEQARKSIKDEVPGFDIDRLAGRTREAWEEKLSKLTVDCPSESDKRIFYTAVYHIYQLPRRMTEAGRYYSAFDDSVHEGVSFNDYATWDTFRAFHPLMTLLEPRMTGDWVQSLLNMYKEGGWLPKWPNPSYTNVMIGTHADAIIADAYTKGIRNFDVPLAYEAMLKDATTPPADDTLMRYYDREPTRNYEARAGLTYYRSVGYVPADRTAESVSRTIEFGVDDWAIAQVAADLNREDDYKMLLNQSRNWKNLWRSDIGFLAPRNLDGSWCDFDLERTYRELWYNVDGSFCEANPWNYLFGAMHDPEGMVELMGQEAFTKKLNEVYDLGKYNHGNEPAHHYDYLFNYSSEPWKTQEKVRQDVREAYWDAPEGMVGNDDCGQMSAWFLLSSMGIYQIAPGSCTFEFGAPQFPHIRLSTGGKSIDFVAENLSEENLYVQDIFVDNKRWTSLRISWDELLCARKIRYVMGPQPKR